MGQSHVHVIQTIIFLTAMVVKDSLVQIHLCAHRETWEKSNILTDGWLTTWTTYCAATILAVPIVLFHKLFAFFSDIDAKLSDSYLFASVAH